MPWSPRRASKLPGTVNCIAQQNLSPDELQQYVTAEGMLNEFQMMWSLRKRFPLHYIVFKQIASHLPHEANVEQYFSRMDWDVARSIPVQEAMIHLKRACKRLRWQDETGWQETIRVQIREAADCMTALDGDPPRNVAQLAELYERCPGGV